MGFSIFFSWDSLRVSRCSWFEQLLVILFFSFFCSSVFPAEHPLTTENKTKIIVRDLLNNAYNRTYQLPVPASSYNLSTMQEVRRANVLRSIAKKVTKFSGAFYSKHPVTGLAVTLGLGYFTDELIDSAFQKFTSASKDSSGFYVMVKNPETGVFQKVYLEDEPTIFNPAFVSFKGGSIFSYDDTFGSCKYPSYDETLNCTINKRFEEIAKIAPSNSVYSDFRVVSKEKSPIYSDGLSINYIYKECFNNSNTCVQQRSSFTVRVKKYEEKLSSSTPKVFWSSEVVPEDKVILKDSHKIANFAKNAVSLNSNEFTDEERRVISNINSDDVKHSFSDYSLKAKDLTGFKYSEDMFDSVRKSEGSSSTDGKDSSKVDTPSKSIDFSSPSVDMPDINPPTARQILEPFNEFFPNLKNFEITEKEVKCPIWSGHIPYLEIDVNLDGHCDYIEKNKSIISSLMLLIWGIISLRVLLSA